MAARHNALNWNLFLAVSSAGAARLLALGAMPIIARIYSPEDFGHLAAFTAIVVIATPFVTLRYSQAIGLAKSDRMLEHLVALCISCTLVAALFVPLGWAVVRELGDPLITLPDIVFFPILIASVLAIGFNETLSALATRDRFYTALAKTVFWQALTAAFWKVVFGLLRMGELGLLLGQVLGQAAGNGTLIRLTGFAKPRRFRALTFSGAKRAALRYRGFPIFRMPSQFLLGAASQAPVLFVVSSFGLAAGGQFGMASTLLTTLITLVSQSVGRVFYGEASHLYRKKSGSLFEFTLQVQLKLLIIGAIPALTVFLFGPTIVGYVLGKDWLQAGQILSLLAPLAIFQLISAPVIQVMNFLKSQLFFLIVNTLRFVAIILLISVIDPQDGINSFARNYAATMCGFYLFTILATLGLLNKSQKRSLLR